MPKLDIDRSRPIVMSIGGSMIVPNGGPDIGFLRNLKNLIKSQAKSGRRIVIVTGGGKTARHYIDAAQAARRRKIDPEDLDWLGIHATRLNGHLVRTVLREIAHPNVVKDPTKIPVKWKGKILVAAGWKPGWSTDYVAVRIARRLGAKSVINVSNVDYVYDVDPRKYKNAKSVEEMRWVDYRKIVGDEWSPCKSAPFDPVASKFCHRYNIGVAIVNGSDFENLSTLLSGSEFKGTLLS